VVIATATHDLTETALSATSEQGADVVLDHAGGQTLASCLTATRVGGRIINIGRLRLLRGRAAASLDCSKLNTCGRKDRPDDRMTGRASCSGWVGSYGNSSAARSPTPTCWTSSSPSSDDNRATFSGSGSGTMSRSVVARTYPCTPTAIPPMTTSLTWAEACDGLVAVALVRVDAGGMTDAIVPSPPAGGVRRSRLRSAPNRFRLHAIAQASDGMRCRRKHKRIERWRPADNRPRRRRTVRSQFGDTSSECNPGKRLLHV
jgi:hypothetical protein